MVLQLPFGSFTASQPPADITVNVAMSNLADVGTAQRHGEAAGLRLPPGSLDGAPAQVRPGRPVSQRGQGQRLRADSAGAIQQRGRRSHAPAGEDSGEDLGS